MDTDPCPRTIDHLYTELIDRRDTSLANPVWWSRALSTTYESFYCLFKLWKCISSCSDLCELNNNNQERLQSLLVMTLRLYCVSILHLWASCWRSKLILSPHKSPLTDGGPDDFGVLHISIHPEHQTSNQIPSKQKDGDRMLPELILF